MQETRNMEEIQKRVSPYKDLFNLLSEKTGENVTATNKSYEIYNQFSAKVQEIIYRNINFYNFRRSICYD